MTREAVSSSAALFLVAILLAGAALRVPHLRGPIDEPHARNLELNAGTIASLSRG